MKIAIALIIAIVVAAGAYFVFAPKIQAPTENPSIPLGDASAPTGTENPNATGDSPAAPAGSVTVTYTDSGFSPKTLTVAPGTKVTFVNNSSHDMWVGSDVHPTHTEYDGTTLMQHCSTHSSFDQCGKASAGGTYSFTFGKAGTFGYHNHVQAADGGSVIVK
jgi:plastocyanin